MTSTDLKKSSTIFHGKSSTSEEQQEKINEVRRSVGQLSDKLSMYCSDASISRYLRARNWNVKKATEMLKETLQWRSEYKPEEIFWDDIAHEAETGKIYRANYLDKCGRPVLVMRPACQNTKSTKGQIRYLVYCMENAILNLPQGQEQMVWLIDFHGFNLSHLSVKVTRETAHVLQNHYPERLGVAILYNPPKIFEGFWTVVKPFLEPKTFKKVKFVYSDGINTRKIMESLFDMEKLEPAFGGNSQVGFNINDFAERMREDDRKMHSFWTRENPSFSPQPSPTTSPLLNSMNSDLESDNSGKEHPENSSLKGYSGTSLPAENKSNNGEGDEHSSEVKNL